MTGKGVPKTLKVGGTARASICFALTRNALATPLAAAAKGRRHDQRPSRRSRARWQSRRTAVDAPNVDLRRLSDGLCSSNSVRLITPAAPAPPAASRRFRDGRRAGRPAQVADAVASRTRASSDWHTLSWSWTQPIDPAFAATLTGVTLTRHQPVHRRRAAGQDRARVRFRRRARSTHRASSDVRKQAGRGEFRAVEVQPLRAPVRLWPAHMTARCARNVKRGISWHSAGDFDVARGRRAAAGEAHLGGSATLTDVEPAISDEKDPPWRIPSLARSPSMAISTSRQASRDVADRDERTADAAATTRRSRAPTATHQFRAPRAHPRTANRRRRAGRPRRCLPRAAPTQRGRTQCAQDHARSARPPTSRTGAASMPPVKQRG